VWIVTHLSEVKKESSIIINVLSFRRPLSVGESAYAVPIFDLKQGDGRTFVIASWVEIFAHPPIYRSTEEKDRNESLIAEEFMQEFFLLHLSDALWI
jgi:hypothetical protein